MMIPEVCVAEALYLALAAAADDGGGSGATFDDFPFVLPLGPAKSGPPPLALVRQTCM